MTIETPTQHKTMKHEGFTNFINLEKTFLHHSNARSFLARCKVLEKKTFIESCSMFTLCLKQPRPNTAFQSLVEISLIILTIDLVCLLFIDVQFLKTFQSIIHFHQITTRAPRSEMVHYNCSQLITLMCLVYLVHFYDSSEEDF